MSYETTQRQSHALQQAIEDGVNKTVYHYTSAEGFHGIVTSSELWLTNAAFVNDTTECKAFLADCAKDLAEDKRLANEYVRKELISRLEDGPENDKYYIASFSRMPDSLSQYRAYGKFCIGFDPRKMKRDRFSMYRCAYKAGDINDWVCRKASVREWNGDCLQDDDKSGVAGDLVFAASVKYKNAAYRDEREMRMVAVSYHTWNRDDYATAMFLGGWLDRMRFAHADDPPIHFRDHSGYGIPIPYVKFFISPEEPNKDYQGDVAGETVTQTKQRKRKGEEAMSREPLPITEVWIGPMMQQEETRLACEIMLREKGYENVPVIASQIPYRGV